MNIHQEQEETPPCPDPDQNPERQAIRTADAIRKDHHVPAGDILALATHPGMAGEELHRELAPLLAAPTLDDTGIASFVDLMEEAAPRAKENLRHLLVAQDNPPWDAGTIARCAAQLERRILDAQAQHMLERLPDQEGRNHRYTGALADAVTQYDRQTPGLTRGQKIMKEYRRRLAENPGDPGDRHTDTKEDP